VKDFLCAERADALESEIRRHPGYRLLRGICGDDKIALLYKGCLSMSQEPHPPCRFPRLRLLAMPAWLFLKHLRNGRARKRIEALAAVPVLWGMFPDKDSQKIAGVRRFNDDGYLYGPHFKRGEVIHIFGDWNIPEPGRTEWKRNMDAMGIPWADRRDFGVNGRLLRLTLRTMRIVLRDIMRAPTAIPMGAELWRATLKGLYHYLLKHYEIENTDYRAEIVKNDYNPGHVAATIAANQSGRKRLGVSHVSSAVDSPQICFVHFDRYATVCPMQEKWHGRFWRDLPIARTGKESIDSIVEAKGRVTDIKRRLDAKHPKAHHTVTILFPGNAERCLVPQWEKMYQGLQLGAAKFILDVRVFLRFRRLTEAMQVPHMAKIANLASWYPKFICEHDDFTTHELMAASDLVITANASFGINEALVAGKAVFTFDYTLKAHQYFGPEYGKDFILTEPEHVERVFEALGEGQWTQDVDWNRMRADADYHHDGRNRERLAQLAREMAG